MKVVLIYHQESDSWEAGCPELPGSPPVGRGLLKEEAKAKLFQQLLFDCRYWEPYLDFTSYSEEETTDWD